MKQKLLSALLALTLSLGLAAPALAAESLDQALSRVTLAVKNTLEIGEYSEFSGNARDLGVRTCWNLNWWEENGGSVSVLADDSGKILQYEKTSGESTAVDGFAPVLSKVTAEQARTAAESFLKKVLTGVETGTPERDGAGFPSGTEFSFSARIALNGVPSANSARLNVDARTGEVCYYCRDDCYSAYVNSLPSASPAVSADRAAQALKGAVALQLRYVRGEDGTAVLRYVPTVNSMLYVDAQTGKLTDMNDAWEALRGAEATNAAGSSESAAADSSTGLSEAEQAAVAQMQGVWSKEKLDSAVRKIGALGLDRYTLKAAEYSTDQESGGVTCVLRYTRPLAYSELTGVDRSDFQSGKYVHTRILEVNARTGELLSGWTWHAWCEKAATFTRSSLQTAADGFFKTWKPDLVSQTALEDGGDETFCYVRTVNDCPYPDNQVSIQIDPSDNSVDSFFCQWEDGLKFESADGLISADAAKNAFCAPWTAELSYLACPVAVDTSLPVWETYAQCCGTVAYRYVLGYTYECSGSEILGVDAKKGKLIRETAAEKADAYTDLSGSYAADQIAALAEAGIRFSADSRFCPRARLTEQDVLVLLANAAEWNFDTESLDEDTLKTLYQAAWDQGFLPRGEQNPAAAVSRAKLVRMVVSATPYGKAAELQGIFKTSFADAAQISAGDLGYVAIAEGLGLIHGDSAHRFNPGRTATRQDAAAILYNYMDR